MRNVLERTAQMSGEEPVPGCSGRLRDWAPLGPDPVVSLPISPLNYERRAESLPAPGSSQPADLDRPTCSRRLCESHTDMSSQEGETLFLHTRVCVRDALFLQSPNKLPGGAAEESLLLGLNNSC